MATAAMKRFSNHKQRSSNISRWIPWAVVLSLGLGCTGNLDKIGGEINPKNKKYHPGRYTQNVTEQAAAGELPAIIGREGELLSMMGGLATGNVILLGGTGAGKTALVHKLAHQIVGGRAGEFNDKTVVLIDLSRLKDLLDEKDLTPQRVLQFLELAMEYWRKERGDQTLFVVDELQTVVAPNKIGEVFVGNDNRRFANAFKAFLDKHKGIVFITTALEYVELSLDDAVIRRSKPVFIGEPLYGDLQRMLRAKFPTASQGILHQAAVAAVMNVFDIGSPDSVFQVLQSALDPRDLLESAATLANVSFDTPLIRFASSADIDRMANRKNQLQLDLVGKRFGMDKWQQRVRWLQDQAREEADLSVLFANVREKRKQSYRCELKSKQAWQKFCNGFTSKKQKTCENQTKSYTVKKTLTPNGSAQDQTSKADWQICKWSGSDCVANDGEEDRCAKVPTDDCKDPCGPVEPEPILSDR